MSTYNGERFLDKQIYSIFHQTGIDVHLLVRDDGSSDNTIKILQSWKKQQPSFIDIIEGKNMGWQDSFLTLLYEAKEREYDLYAFSDQDDVWAEDKLYTASQHLAEYQDTNIPVLYYTSQHIVDENEQPLYTWKPYSSFRDDEENSRIRLLFPGVAYAGCAQVFNRALLLKAVSGEKEQLIGKKIAHDHWIGIITAWFGKVILHDTVAIYHRSHPDSVTTSGRPNTLKDKFNMDMPHYAEVFYAIYHAELQGKDVEYAVMMGNYKKKFRYKLKLLTDKRIMGWKPVMTIKFKLAILLNLF